MMTAEKWYEYQNNYKKYGLEMKPEAPRVVREVRSPGIPLRNRAIMISLLVVTGILFICLMISRAYIADVKYEINSISKENAVLQGEIDNLNVKIKNATNIKTIEERALNELGMVTPLPEQFVFLTHKVKPEGDFAMLLMEQAYN